MSWLTLTLSSWSHPPSRSSSEAASSRRLWSKRSRSDLSSRQELGRGTSQCGPLHCRIRERCRKCGLQLLAGRSHDDKRRPASREAAGLCERQWQRQGRRSPPLLAGVIIAYLSRDLRSLLSRISKRPTSAASISKSWLSRADIGGGRLSWHRSLTDIG